MCEVSGVLTYAAAGTMLVAREPAALPPKPPRLLDRVRDAVRARHYSRRTEKAYVAWTRRYVLFHGKRHPSEMGAPELTRFLSSLAVDGNVAASTQNQALSALLFLYREVLEQDVPWLDDVVRAKRPVRLPIVLTRAEVRTVLRQLRGTPRLMAILMFRHRFGRVRHHPWRARVDTPNPGPVGYGRSRAIRRDLDHLRPPGDSP